MRIDHHAYQRATRVALVGLLLQVAIFLLLVIFGNVGRDAEFSFASKFVAPGMLVWIGLCIVFHQHKLERLEALEDDELAATRAGATSVFEPRADESRVAARRLAMLHKWLMPALSLLIALVLAWFATRMFNDLARAWRGDIDLNRTPEKGWAVAICLLAAVISFIFSRYVAGMSKQQAWANLRGGAAYMVGNSLVLLAIAVGEIFRFLQEDKVNETSGHQVIDYIGWAIPVFMSLLALEIVVNFILNLYRPRIPGEVPRPAFDSKILSLFATPDSIVRSLNEAVNYQFGFDVTSSWGYQLLLRSFFSLVGLGLVAMVLLSTMIIVEPHQQAIRLRGGKIVDDRIYESGVMWKLPWPFESAEVYDITPIRNLHLTSKVVAGKNVPLERQANLWDEAETPKTDVPLDPFVVGSNLRGAAYAQGGPATRAVDVSGEKSASEADRAAEMISDSYSLVDAEIVLEYRIRKDKGGLLEYLHFAPDTYMRRQQLTERERALRALALEQVSAHLLKLPLNDVLAPGRFNLAGDLRERVQASFDVHRTGVDVVAVNLPMLRPSGKSAPSFEELGISVQANKKRIAEMDRTAVMAFANFIGNVNLKDEVLKAIDEHDQLRDTVGRDAPETITQRLKVESLLVQGGGQAAQMIADAERDRWVTMMNKKAQANRVQSQLAAYLAAPRLYREREIMRVYKQYLPNIDKYFIGVDPKLVDIGIDLKKLPGMFDFSGNSPEEVNRKNE